MANAILGNKDVTVRTVNIDGYASPEGQEANNIRLADGRAKSFVKYLEQTYGLSTRLFHVEGHGEDWAGLRQCSPPTTTSGAHNSSKSSTTGTQ